MVIHRELPEAANSPPLFICADCGTMKSKVCKEEGQHQREGVRGEERIGCGGIGKRWDIRSRSSLRFWDTRPPPTFPLMNEEGGFPVYQQR